MLQYLFRFVVGGVIVSAFAAVGGILKPKSFAGLFGAAPSVALATIGLTIHASGKQSRRHGGPVHDCRSPRLLSLRLFSALSVGQGAFRRRDGQHCWSRYLVGRRHRRVVAGVEVTGHASLFRRIHVPQDDVGRICLALFVWRCDYIGHRHPRETIRSCLRRSFSGFPRDFPLQPHSHRKTRTPKEAARGNIANDSRPAGGGARRSWRGDRQHRIGVLRTGSLETAADLEARIGPTSRLIDMVCGLFSHLARTKIPPRALGPSGRTPAAHCQASRQNQDSRTPRTSFRPQSPARPHPASRLSQPRHSQSQKNALYRNPK